MATESRAGLTYADLQAMFPEEDLVLRELIEGELYVTPPPTWRHQQAVSEVVGVLWAYAKHHGGRVSPAPTGVLLSDENFVEPDVLFLREESLGKAGKLFVRSAPDLVVEVSSPSTRLIDLGRKRDLYERFGAQEYWFVDLDSDEIHVYRSAEGRFEPPLLFGRGDMLESPLLPGLAVAVDDVLGAPDDA